MKEDFYKYKFFLVLVILVIIFWFGISFIFDKNMSDDEVLKLETPTSELVVSNEFPMTDSAGRMLSYENNKLGITGYVEFEVKSLVEKNIKYEIYLTKENAESEISDKFIKVFLTDDQDVALGEYDGTNIPTYFELKPLKKYENGKLLYKGSLKDKKSKNFKLRVWVADTYELSGEQKKFSIKLNVR